VETLMSVFSVPCGNVETLISFSLTYL